MILFWLHSQHEIQSLKQKKSQFIDRINYHSFYRMKNKKQATDIYGSNFIELTVRQGKLFYCKHFYFTSFAGINFTMIYIQWFSYAISCLLWKRKIKWKLAFRKCVCVLANIISSSKKIDSTNEQRCIHTRNKLITTNWSYKTINF